MEPAPIAGGRPGERGAALGDGTTVTPPDPSHDPRWPPTLARAALLRFDRLPRAGKPQAHEHTTLAAVAATLPGSCDPLLLSLATGTKCLGQSRLSPDGSAVGDMHAEVLARRTFLLWICEEAERVLLGRGSEVLEVVGPGTAGMDGQGGPAARLAPRRLLRMRPGTRLHLFSSHPPCGDAAVDAGGGEEPAARAVLGGADDALGSGAPASSCPGSTLRTGAKPLLSGRKRVAREEVGDEAGAGGGDACGEAGGETSEEAGAPSDRPSGFRAAAAGGAAGEPPPSASDVESSVDRQAPGVTRRKPGRGDPTLSMSCSDKILRWSLLGFEGSLLAGFFEAPLPLSSVVVGVPTALRWETSRPHPREGGAGGAACGDPAADPPSAALLSVQASAERALATRAPARARAAAARALGRDASPAPLVSTVGLAGGDEAAVGVAPTGGGPAAGLAMPKAVPRSPRFRARDSSPRPLSELGLLKTPSRQTPGGSSLCWRRVDASGGGATEVITCKVGKTQAGFKAGKTRQAPGSLLCKRAMLERFIALGRALGVAEAEVGAAGVGGAEGGAAGVDGGGRPAPHSTSRPLSYLEAKRLSSPGRRAAWLALRAGPDSPFVDWLDKPPEFETFSLEEPSGPRTGSSSDTRTARASHVGRPPKHP